MRIRTKVVGVTFNNPDGTSRQSILSRLNSYSLIMLLRDRENIYDPNAIAVLNSNGEQIGFINRELAATLAPLMDSGSLFEVTITSLTGGDNGYTRGCNILIREIGRL